MKYRPPANPLTAQVTFTVLALAVFSLAMVIGFGLFATIRADRDSLEKQKAFVANGIAEQVESLVRQQRTVTVWDDSVTNAKAGAQAWMTENLGAWLYAYYGHDRVYVIDTDGRPVHVMREGKTLEPAAYEEDRNALAPSIGRMRALIAEALANPDDPPKLVVTDMLSVDGRPAIVSIQPILPSSTRVVQAGGTEYLHVDIRFVDQSMVDRIASKFLLSGAHLVSDLATPLAASGVPLVDSHGVILGYIAWDQERPGFRLIRDAGPALLAGLLLAAGVLTFLLRRLRRASAELQTSQYEAEYLAFHDMLTGLPNRTLFDDRLRRALASAARDGTRVALLYLDLDRFKHVNDTFGHPVGDELVRQSGGRLLNSVRDIDTVARLGGDEFAVIVVGIRDLRVAEDLCRRMLEQMGQPFDLVGNQVFVGASIGVALSAAGTEPADLLRKADIALYEAKKNGRNRYQIFAGDMDDVLLHKRVIETDLRAALAAGNQLRLAYQPIHAADCTTVVGAEALLRWRHPVHGELTPGQFVTIAEERGLIAPLGKWVLREAVRFAASSSLPWVAVNISPLQLRDDGFPLAVMAILAEFGVQPDRLQLEITESTLLENSDAANAALAELRKAGVHIALDDFGTGYSSISYLRRHAIDKLKIDRSFVQLLGSESGAAIVRALVDLAVALRVQVTAEGVETEEQKLQLVAMGCHELQGFLLSVPLDGRRLERLHPVRPESGRFTSSA